MISSSWRLDSNLLYFLEKVLTEEFGNEMMSGTLIGDINSNHGSNRSSAITDWIAANVPSDQKVTWLAIDDVAFNLDCIENVHKVITHDTVGLTEVDVACALQKINAQRAHLFSPLT